MAKKIAQRLATHGWLYAPAASGPVGGGLIKIGGGDTWAAVLVAIPPYVLCGLIDLVFVVGFLAGLVRFMFAGAQGQRDMERLIRVSAAAVVAIRTLTPSALADQGTLGAEPTSRGRGS